MSSITPIEISNQYFCAASKAIMIQPLRLACGHVFEKLYLDKHLSCQISEAGGKPTCPLDGSEIEITILDVDLATKVSKFVDQHPFLFKNRSYNNLFAELELKELQNFSYQRLAKQAKIIERKVIDTGSGELWELKGRPIEEFAKEFCVVGKENLILKFNPLTKEKIFHFEDLQRCSISTQKSILLALLVTFFVTTIIFDRRLES